MRISVALFAAALALTGCKSKAEKKSPPAAAGSGSAVVVAPPVGSGSGSGTPVTLFKGDGTPPKKTTKPIDQETVDKLTKLEFPTFTAADRTRNRTFEVRLSTARPRLATTVTAQACFDCVPMELAKWQAKTDALKVMLPEELRSLPDTTFEVGKIELNGQPMIYTYQFGYLSSKDEANNVVGAFSNAYILYFNDGVNQIRVVSEYKDDWLAKDAMLAIAPREDLEKIARSFMDAYTHAW